jgi:hypothetical protein
MLRGVVKLSLLASAAAWYISDDARCPTAAQITTRSECSKAGRSLDGVPSKAKKGKKKCKEEGCLLKQQKGTSKLWWNTKMCSKGKKCKRKVCHAVCRGEAPAPPWPPSPSPPPPSPSPPPSMPPSGPGCATREAVRAALVTQSSLPYTSTAFDTWDALKRTDPYPTNRFCSP